MTALPGPVAELLHEREEMEIELCDKLDDPQKLAEYITSCTQQLLLYLVVNRLEDARFLWRRTQNIRDKAPQLQAAWEVGKCLWKRANIPEALRLLGQPSWEPDVVPYAAHALQKVRDREIEVVGRVYLKIPLAEVASQLLLSEQEALEVCHRHDWTVEADRAMVHPKRLPETEAQLDGFKQLQHLTSIITQLTT